MYWDPLKFTLKYRLKLCCRKPDYIRAVEPELIAQDVSVELVEPIFIDAGIDPQQNQQQQ